MIPEDAQLMSAHQYKTAKKEIFALSTDETNMYPMGTKGDAVLSLAYAMDKSAELTPAATKHILDKIAEQAVLSSWLDVYEYATKKASLLIDVWEQEGLTDGVKTASYDESVPCAYTAGNIRKYATITDTSLEDSITEFVNEYTFMDVADRVKVAGQLISAAGTHGLVLDRDSSILKIASSDGSSFAGNILEPVIMDKEFDLTSKDRVEVSITRFKTASYDPCVMRTVALEITKAAEHYGVDTTDKIRKHASNTLNPGLKTAMYDRLKYVREEGCINEIKDLVKRAEARLFTVDEILDAVETFDKLAGLHRMWGDVIQSPIDSVLSLVPPVKTAEGDISDDDGAGENSDMKVEFEGQAVSPEQMKNAIANSSEELASVINDTVIEGLSGPDFPDVFNALPDPIKRTLIAIITGQEFEPEDSDEMESVARDSNV